jgi:hypothetical protein
MATLGSALDDKPMRDAGIFAYTLETHGVGEYWFDRDSGLSRREQQLIQRANSKRRPKARMSSRPPPAH